MRPCWHVLRRLTCTPGLTDGPDLARLVSGDGGFAGENLWIYRVICECLAASICSRLGECSCNILVLLEHGARLDERNRWGQNALDLARQRHDMVAVRVLETLGAKP